MKRGAYHLRAIPVQLQPIHGTHLVCLQHATQGLVTGEELKYFVVSMFGTVGKKKKKSKTTINHHTQSAIPWETLWLWPSLQTGNAHLKRPEWTSTQEATTLWTCSNRRVLERETKPFGSEWSWCVEKLCINASDTQWRLTKKGNGHLAFPVKGLSSWAIPTSEMKSHHGLQPAEPGTQRQTYGTVQSHLSWYVWLTLDF